jgi:Lipoate-protein ligase A
MLNILENNTNPYWNLAAEEYLLKNFNEPIFRLWRNDNSIIVGQHQNTIAEIDVDYVKNNGIKVVRRLSGGGAVFHDLGNLNFTFIEEKKMVKMHLQCLKGLLLLLLRL